MFLRRIALTNVKAIEECELDFVNSEGKTRKWTLIVSDNGNGKSTLLRALALLFAGSEALPGLIGEPDAWIRQGKDECRFDADFATDDNEMRSISLNLRRGDNLMEIFRRNEESLAALDRALGHATRNYFTVGYGAERQISKNSEGLPPALVDGYNPRAQAVATLFASNATLSPLESWAIDLHYRRGELGLRLVRQALRGLSPRAEFENIDKEQHQLLFKTPDGVLPASLLGGGYRNIATWYGDFVYRMTQAFGNYSNPFSARGLLIIDEIDLHLDASWKRRLYQFLGEKLPKMQIVATTDSPLMVQQAGEGEVWVLRRETAQAAPTLVQYPYAPNKLSLHQLLLSPIFDLGSVDSTKVEDARQQYESLKSKPKSELTRTQKTQLSRAKRDLEDLPLRTSGLPSDNKEIAMLQDMKDLLSQEVKKSRRRKNVTIS